MGRGDTVASGTPAPQASPWAAPGPSHESGWPGRSRTHTFQEDSLPGPAGPAGGCLHLCPPDPPPSLATGLPRSKCEAGDKASGGVGRSGALLPGSWGEFLGSCPLRGGPPLCASLCLAHGVPSGTALALLCSHEIPAHLSKALSSHPLSRRRRTSTGQAAASSFSPEALCTSSLCPSTGPGTPFWVPVSQDPRLLGSGRCAAPLGLSLSGTPQAPGWRELQDYGSHPKADRGPQPAPPEEEMKQGLWAPQHGCWRAGPGAAGSELASASGPVALSSRAVWGPWPGNPFSQQPWETAAIPMGSSPRLQSARSGLAPTSAPPVARGHPRQVVQVARPSVSTAACGFPEGSLQESWSLVPPSLITASRVGEIQLFLTSHRSAPLCRGKSSVSTLYTKIGTGQARGLLGKASRGKARPRLGRYRSPTR